MITITIRPGPVPKPAPPQQRRSTPQSDIAAVVWMGQAYEAKSTAGAAMALARQLVAAGCPDQAWECRTPEGQRTVYGRSLHNLARLTIRETEGKPVVGRYVERPDFMLVTTKNAPPAPSEGEGCGEGP